jgi:hypothetical protein
VPDTEGGNNEQGNLPIREALDGLGGKAGDLLDDFHRNAFSQGIFGNFLPARHQAFFTASF